MTKDLVALDDLINKAVSKESELEQTSKELAQRDEQFAQYLKQKKIMDDELKTLWEMVRSFMEENELKEYHTEWIDLRLAPIGKYKAENIDEVPDELCKISKTLDNKKIKAYQEINGSLPDGILSLGNRLIKRILK